MKRRTILKILGCKERVKVVLVMSVQICFYIIYFYPTALKGCLRAVGVLFSPMVRMGRRAGGRASWRAGGWVGGRREKVCPGCISETVRCRKLILGRDIG